MNAEEYIFEKKERGERVDLYTSTKAKRHRHLRPRSEAVQ